MSEYEKFVPGNGPKPNPIMLIGEAPGRMEAQIGRPFVGDAGDELRGLYLPLAYLRFDDLYVTNVYKYRPPNNRTPNDKEIAEGLPILMTEVSEVDPDYIIVAGTTAANVFGCPRPFEQQHGIPYPWAGRTVIPVYHPASGLHQTSMMKMVMEDFTSVGKVLCNEDVRNPLTNAVTSSAFIIGVDTETVGESVWSVQIARDKHKTACLFPNNDFENTLIRRDCALSDMTVFHNAPFDYRQLQKLGIEPRIYTDTMQMSYLLGGHQKLKTLAFRYFGTEMQSFKELVAESSNRKARQYLEQIISVDWPEQTPVTEFKKKKLKNRHPQNIATKVRKLLEKADEDPTIDLADKWNRMKDKSQAVKKFGDMPMGTINDIPQDKAIAYAKLDADMTLKLYHSLMPRIKVESMEDALQADMDIVPMIVEMEQCGMKVDVDKLRRLNEDLTAQQDNLFRTINKECRRLGLRAYNEYFNPNSSPQITELLTKLGIHTKSTEAKYVEPHADNHEVIKNILDYKHLGKARSTYIKTLIREGLKFSDCRVRARFNMSRTGTGRLSSSNPINWQNIPVRSEIGKQIRKCIVPENGNSFAGIDYSQIEMRVAAHMSQDDRLLDIFRRGLDIHSMTSESMFGNSDDENRYAAKRVGFGVMYGISASGLLELFESEGVKRYNMDDCEDFIKGWFDVYPGVRNLMDRFHSEAIETGKVRDMFGRVRYTPEVYSKVDKVYHAGLRQAGNAPIQSGAQGVIKRAMAKTWKIRERFTFDVVNQIHDELLFELPTANIQTTIPVIKSVMEHAVTLSVPTPCDVELSNSSWGELEEVEI